MKPVSRLLVIIDTTSVILLLIATGMVFFYAPVEKVMGLVQKVFYFHVAAGWAGMLGFLVAAVAAIIYLSTGENRWDVLSHSSVEVGMLFALINVVTGSIWARPIWNTWWTWDPRLTTVTIMLLIFAAYFILRSGIDDPLRRARFASVYTIVGFLSIPLTFFSARMFRTIHPIIIGAGQISGSSPFGTTGAFDMSTRMLQTFLLSLLAFSVVFTSLLWHRVHLGNLAEEVEQLKLEKID
jgi:heme exporter protein C